MSAVIRGQLSENFLRSCNAGGCPWLVRVILTHLLTAFFTRPDFIAYNHIDRSCPSLRLMKKLYHVQEVGGTIRSRDVLAQLETEHVIPIFENFLP